MWTKKRLNEYISGAIEENKHLEYKAAGALGKNEPQRKEISKDVSAFANSDGGIIIYGISEFDDKEKTHLPEKLSPVSRVDYPKEWLENIITGNISPVITDLIIHPVTLDESQNTVAYVVEIPKSFTAHQAMDNKYYKRHNFKSIPMEDWEVKDVIHRASRPIIEMTLSAYSFDDLSSQSSGSSHEISIVLKNTGSIAAQQIECFLETSRDLMRMIKKPKVIELKNVIQIPFNNRKENKLTIGNRETTISVYYEPLLPTVWRQIGIVEVRPALFDMDIIIKCIVATEFGVSSKDFRLKEIIIKN